MEFWIPHGRMAVLKLRIGQQAVEICFIEGLLAAHRRMLDVAGIDRKPAVRLKVIKPIVDLGQDLR